MPDVQHSTLTGAELHEPKGISGASSNETYVADGAGSGAWAEPEPKGVSGAADGAIYHADGAGSGSWQVPYSGWGNYSDNAGTQVFNTTPAKISINGLGSSTEESYLPLDIRGSDSLWDTTLDVIDPIAVGDAYSIRLVLPVTAESGSPTELTVELDIGGSTHASGVFINTKYASTGKSTPYTLTLDFNIYTLATAVANNVQVWITSDTGTVTVTDPSIFIARNHSELT
jgi:hypothetical protein